MKLHEIKRGVSKGGKGEKRITIEPADGRYGDVKLDVEFNFTPGNSRGGNHPEDSDDEFDVTSVKLAQEVEQLDDGNEVVKTWPKGTDADKLPGWTRKDDRAVEEKL